MASSIANSSQTNIKPEFDNLADWLKWQDRLHFTTIELGLDRCKKVATNMGLLPPPYKVVSVTGTNGKGSCTMLLGALLTRAGYNVGVYTSPHLINYQERIRINGTEVSAKMLCTTFSEIDDARENTSLTYFEFGTLAALKIFANAGLDIAIFEVGMGGRLDAVNIIDADIALVSSVDLDHTFWLGNDRESIGFEKAGIFRCNTPAIYADTCPPKRLVDYAKQLGTKLYQTPQDFKLTETGGSWQWHFAGTTLDQLPKTDYLQDVYLKNAAGVLMVLTLLKEELPVSKTVIYDGLTHFRLPGRFQILHKNNQQIVLDVAHNGQAAKILHNKLVKLARKPTHAILGMLKEKEHRTFIKALVPVIDNWLLPDMNSNRCICSKRLGQFIKEVDQSASINYCQDIVSGLKQLLRGKPNKRILITGSFITVGATMPYLENLPDSC